jgi:hydroxymethylglutaryl-CoA reductase
MQRAPVFVFENARQSRRFVHWVNEYIDRIREEAEATSSVAKLQYIDPYLASKFAYLRFNFSTGDAAGQNMVGRATFAACSWIIDNYGEPIQHFLPGIKFCHRQEGVTGQRDAHAGQAGGGRSGHQAQRAGPEYAG